MSEQRLFQPLKIGNIEVKHRIGMPSLTRVRASDDRVPTPLMKEYYSQRASIPGTMILAEGTFINATSGGFPNAPGIWNEAQVEAWRTITDEVHRKGSFIYLQLAGMGRAAVVAVAQQEGGRIIAPSAIPIEGGAIPEAMTIEDIKQAIEEFAVASKNAIRAGFDGVECHAANGYLVDQFLQDNSNQRTDEYGGTVENRSRFVVEVLEAMIDAVGAERVGMRLSPYSTFQDMKMKNPIPQFTDIIKKAHQLGVSYIHLVESRISGAVDTDGEESLDFAYKLWDRPLLIAGGYTPEEARKIVDSDYPDKEVVVMFGRQFISNPDLVYRIKHELTLTPYDRKTFYATKSPIGYVDYPFSAEYLASDMVSVRP